MSDLTVYVDENNTEYGFADTSARGDISAINGKIPSNASSSNKMATENSLTSYVKKSSTIGLLKNDGTVDTTSYATTSALNNKADNTPTFTEASTRANIVSGEAMPTMLGKIKKYFADLKTVAFTGSYNDLTDKPSIPTGQVNSDWNATSGVAQILNKPTIPAAQIQSDWNQTNTSAKDYIKNKPSIPSGVVVDTELSTTSTNPVQNKVITSALNGKANSSSLATVATTGSYNDLSNKPTIPAAQVNSDWNATSGKAQILNKPTIPAAQIQSDWNQTNTSAKDYIKNKPDIPSAVTVDSALSTTSLNPVQNKLTTRELNIKAGYGNMSTNDFWLTMTSSLDGGDTLEMVTIEKDSTPTSGSTKTVTSGGVYTALLGKASNTPTFSEASTRANIASGETMSTILGKIKKYFTDLKTVAFSGSYNDLSNKPTIPTVDSSLSTSSTNTIQNKVVTNALNAKLPLAGGSMTGKVTFNNVSNAIAYQGTKASYDMIKFKDNTSDEYGNGIVIGGGGLTVIGGGEAADTVAATHTTGGDEVLELASDAAVNVWTNTQDGTANAKKFIFGTNGILTSPAGFSGMTSSQVKSALGYIPAEEAKQFTGYVTLSSSQTTSVTFPGSAYITKGSVIEVWAGRYSYDVDGGQNEFPHKSVYTTDGSCTVTFPKVASGLNGVTIEVRIYILN